MTLSLPRIAFAAQAGVDLGRPVATPQCAEKILRGDAVLFRFGGHERDYAVGVFNRERVVDGDIRRFGNCSGQGDLMFVADADGGHSGTSECCLAGNYTIVGKLN